jgi:hypothetical protein
MELRRTPPAVFLVCTECMYVETTFEPTLALAAVALVLSCLTCKGPVGNQYRQNISPHVGSCARPTILHEQDSPSLLVNLRRMGWTGISDFKLRYFNDAICLRSKLRRDER